MSALQASLVARRGPCRQASMRTAWMGGTSPPPALCFRAAALAPRASCGRLQRMAARFELATAPPPAQPARQQSKVSAAAVWVAGGLGLAALLGGATLLLLSGPALPLIAAARQHLSGSFLGRSGFFAAFSLIFLSEVGDKTFFIAALLAMRLGRWISWCGSTASLAAMTVISVGIGYAVKSVPAVVESSEVVGQWLGALLLLYFGARTLRDAWMQSDDADAGEELEEAEESVNQAEKGGKISNQQTPWQALVEVASLIFVAEWGDRSMLATIALGAAQSPLGVAGGAIMAHAAATWLAVAGGAALSKQISEKTVGYISGVLFLVFAGATMLGLF